MANLRQSMPNDQQNPASVNDKRKRARIIVYTNDDGTADLSALTDEQRSQLGVGSPSAAATDTPSVQFAPQMMAMILPVLVSIESAVVAPRIGIDQEKVRVALTPPDAIAEGICEASTKVLNKYGGALGPYADELALASLLIMWQVSAFGELRRIKAESTPAPEPAPPSIEVNATAEIKTASKRAPKVSPIDGPNAMRQGPPSDMPSFAGAE